MTLDAYRMNCTTAKYHAHEALSCSRFLAAGLYTEDESLWTPHLYAAPEHATSEALDIGTLVHAGYYEPEIFPSLYAVRPVKPDGKLVACNTKEFGAWALDHQGKIHVHPDDIAGVHGMVDALTKAEQSGCLRTYRRTTTVISTEVPYLVQCPITGLWLRIKPDQILQHNGNGSLICEDLKTSKDVSPLAFRKSCRYDFQYYRRAAFYCYALEIMTGDTWRYIMPVVESSPPHLVALYEVDEEHMAQAMRENRDSLAALARCIDTGDFRPAWLKGAYKI